MAEYAENVGADSGSKATDWMKKTGARLLGRRSSAMFNNFSVRILKSGRPSNVAKGSCESHQVLR